MSQDTERWQPIIGFIKTPVKGEREREQEGQKRRRLFKKLLGDFFFGGVYDNARILRDVYLKL